MFGVMSATGRVALIAGVYVGGTLESREPVSGGVGRIVSAHPRIHTCVIAKKKVIFCGFCEYRDTVGSSSIEDDIWKAPVFPLFRDWWGTN